MLLKVKLVVTLGGWWLEGNWSFCDASNFLFLNLGATYIIVFSLWKLSKRYAYITCTFMYVYLCMRYILYFNKMGKDKVPHYTSSFMHFQQIEFIILYKTSNIFMKNISWKIHFLTITDYSCFFNSECFANHCLFPCGNYSYII